MDLNQDLNKAPAINETNNIDGSEVISLDIKVPGDYKFTIEILKTTPLNLFHEIIQNHVNFDNDHLYQFFIAKNAFNQRDIIGHVNSYEPDKYIKSISKIKLGSLFPLLKGFKLYYLFDFGDSWYFEIKQTRATIKDFYERKYYPRITKSSGKIPEQYQDEYEN